MKAYRIHGPMDLRLDEIPEPVCGAGEVKIKTKYCGLCGSDRGRLIEAEVPFTPNTIGHEYSAEVVEVGAGVTGVAPGDKVIVVPLMVCHQCENCLTGHYGQCINSRFSGLRVPDMGAFAEYNVFPEVNVIKIPEDMDLLKAAFIEPLSVAIHSLLQVEFKPGKDVAIVGAGTIGLLIVQAARAMGARNIHVFDIAENQLEEAKRCGADFTYNTRDDGALAAYKQNTGGLGVPYVLEVVGLESTVQYSLKLCKMNGVVGLVGHLEKPLTLSAADMRIVLSQELKLYGIWMSYDEIFPGDGWRLGIRYLYEGKVNVDRMLDRVIPPEEVMQACEDWKKPGVIKGKIMVDFTKTW